MAKKILLPWMHGSKSQLGQESFVLWILNQKTDGFYIEIGASHPTNLSNTFLLESKFSWRGIGLEIDPKLTNYYNQNRSNLCLNLNAIETNYRDLFETQAVPMKVDYLQVDIEPPKNTYLALKRVMKSRRIFSVITFEHDLYASKFNYFWKVRAFFLLRLKGYTRCANNVSNGSAKQEDWYIHKTLGARYRLKSNVDFKEFFKKSQMLE